jgi:hypothetical protein
MKDQTDPKKNLKTKLAKIIVGAALIGLTSCYTTEYSVGVSTYRPYYHYYDYYDGPIYSLHFYHPPPVRHFDIGPRYHHFGHPGGPHHCPPSRHR